MTGDFDDDLRRRLGGLSADLDGVPLPGPTAARERAARRTRHQVAGTVLAGVAAVAAGVAIISPPGLVTTPNPAPPATLSTPMLTDPADPADPTDPAEAGLDPSAGLLTAGDVAGDTGVEWTETGDPGPEVSCDPSPVVDTMSALRGRAQVAFTSEAGTVRQDLIRFVDGGSATGVADELFACLDERGADDLPWVASTVGLTGIGDEGWAAQYYEDPTDQQADVATVAIVRSRDVVSITVQTETGADTVGGQGALDLAVPIAAAERMCAELYDDTCVSDPSAEDLTGADPTEPERELLQLADDPFLADEDVAAVGSATGFFRSTLDPSETTAYQAPCLQDPLDAGADRVLPLGFSHDLDASLVEWVLQLPTVDSAAQVVAAHLNLPDVCGEVGEDREQTVGDPVGLDVEGADDAVAWTVEGVPTADNAGSSTSFAGIGIARVANLVVVVSFAAMDDPSGGDWPSVVSGLLARAVDRSIG